jgi:hypothetical protein
MSDVKKYCIKAFVTLFVTLFIISHIFAEIKSLTKVDFPTGKAFWGELEKSVYEFADSKNDLDPEQVERIATALSAIVSRAEPFVKELQPILNPQCSTAKD